MENSSTVPMSHESAATSEFAELVREPHLQSAIARAGFTAPTPVQREAIPIGLAGNDLIVQAKTGSGKTVAFLIPLLSKLRELKAQRATTALILTPTRELATQIADVLGALEPTIQPVLLIGGMSMAQQREALDRDRRVIVGTPGRTLDFIRQKEIVLRTVRFFVLDEADEMFSMGFYEDVTAILDKLPPDKLQRQGILVSATMSSRVQALAERYLRDPQKIAVTAPEEQHANIDHTYIEVEGTVAQKANALCDLIEVEKPRSAIIFCNTKSDTELVEAFLRRRGFNARRINSDLAQKQRNAVMEKIRNGELQYLVGTDLAARGIDIDTIDLVVNYALPDMPEVYVHRSGRTGRAGRSGKAVSIIAPQDLPHFLSLKRSCTFEFRAQPLPTEEDVIAARRNHLVELLKRDDRPLSPRDLAQSRDLIATSADPVVLEQRVALFIRSYVESAVKAPNVALEEELARLDREVEADSERREHAPQRERGRSNRRRGDDHRRRR